jgi:hypothetical protein
MSKALELAESLGFEVVYLDGVGYIAEQGEQGEEIKRDATIEERTLWTELRRQHAEIEALKNTLQFVERWAVHHGTKPHMTPQEALSCIQHHPAIKAITKSYADGVVPTTFDPFAEIEALRKEAEQERESRGMFVSRLENRQRGDDWLTVTAVLALLNDCDYLASRSASMGEKA